MPDEKKLGSTTSSHLGIPAELPSVETVLKMAGAAMKKLWRRTILSKVDVMRLGRLIAGVEKYTECMLSM